MKLIELTELSKQLTKISIALPLEIDNIYMSDDSSSEDRYRPINMKIRLLGNRIRRGVDSTFFLFTTTSKAKRGFNHSDNAPSVFPTKLQKA